MLMSMLIAQSGSSCCCCCRLQLPCGLQQPLQASRRASGISCRALVGSSILALLATADVAKAGLATALPVTLRFLCQLAVMFMTVS